jgi:hypothetical protein
MFYNMFYTLYVHDIYMKKMKKLVILKNTCIFVHRIIY